MVEQVPGQTPSCWTACYAKGFEGGAGRYLTAGEVSPTAQLVRLLAEEVGGEEPGVAESGTSSAWFRDDNETPGARGERHLGGSAYLGTPRDMASVDYEWEGSEVLVLTISGDVDMSNVDILREKLATILQPRTRRVSVQSRGARVHRQLRLSCAYRRR